MWADKECTFVVMVDCVSCLVLLSGDTFKHRLVISLLVLVSNRTRIDFIFLECPAYLLHVNTHSAVKRQCSFFGICVGNNLYCMYASCFSVVRTIKRAALSKSKPPVPLMSNLFSRDQPNRDLWVFYGSIVCKMLGNSLEKQTLRRTVKLLPCDYRACKCTVSMSCDVENYDAQSSK